MLAALSGAREIKRTDMKIRLIPLLEIVFEKAKHKTPSMINSINLKIIHDNSPNAFAIGRKTICVTDGLLNLSDDEIMAVFAHEIGHLAYQHSVIQLLIGWCELFISGFLVIIKCVCWISDRNIDFNWNYYKKPFRNCFIDFVRECLYCFNMAVD